MKIPLLRCNDDNAKLSGTTNVICDIWYLYDNANDKNRRSNWSAKPMCIIVIYNNDNNDHK